MKMLKIALVILLVAVPYSAQAATIEIEIVTEIRDTWPDALEGVKSRHTVVLDTTEISAVSKYETGETLGIESINDNFSVSSPSYADATKSISFSVTGQTETGIAMGAMASIDYKFDIRVIPGKSLLWVSGVHNEYPSYNIKVNGKEVYDREETGNPMTGLLDGNSVSGVFVDGASY